jgi:hypothetical protein
VDFQYCSYSDDDTNCGKSSFRIRSGIYLFLLINFILEETLNHHLSFYSKDWAKCLLRLMTRMEIPKGKLKQGAIIIKDYLSIANENNIISFLFLIYQ